MYIGSATLVYILDYFSPQENDPQIGEEGWCVPDGWKVLGSDYNSAGGAGEEGGVIAISSGVNRPDGIGGDHMVSQGSGEGSGGGLGKELGVGLESVEWSGHDRHTVREGGGNSRSRARSISLPAASTQLREAGYHFNLMKQSQP